MTDRFDLSALPLRGVGDFTFGDWDIAPTGLMERARPLARDGGAVHEALRAKLVSSGKALGYYFAPPSARF